MNGGGVGGARFRAFPWELLDGWLGLRYRVMSFRPCLMDTVPCGYRWCPGKGGGGGCFCVWLRLLHVDQGVGGGVLK